MKRKIFILGLGVFLLVLGGIVLLWVVGGKSLKTEENFSRDLQNLANQLASSTDPVDNLVVNSLVTKGQLPTAIKPEVLAKTNPNPLGELPTISPETSQAPTQYGQAFALAIKPFLESHTQNMAKLLLDYVDQKPGSTLTGIQTGAQGIMTSLTLLRQVAIPPSIRPTHLSFIEHLVKTGELVSLMTRVDAEPIIALQAAQQYQMEYALTMKSLLDINQYFIDHGVKFASGTAPTIMIAF